MILTLLIDSDVHLPYIESQPLPAGQDWRLVAAEMLFRAGRYAFKHSFARRFKYIAIYLADPGNFERQGKLLEINLPWHDPGDIDEIYTAIEETEPQGRIDIIEEYQIDSELLRSLPRPAMRFYVAIVRVSNSRGSILRTKLIQCPNSNSPAKIKALAISSAEIDHPGCTCKLISLSTLSAKAVKHIKSFA